MATKTETVKENTITQKNSGDSETKNYKTESSVSENSKNCSKYFINLIHMTACHISITHPIFSL